jgi:hypothetical protein
MQGYLCLSNFYITILPLFTLQIAKKFDGHCCLLLMITVLPIAFVKSQICLTGLLGISPILLFY